MNDDELQSYTVVQLANGSYSLRSSKYGETFHPVIGPEREAETLYLKQLRLVERAASEKGVFYIWDVGLGAGANILTVLSGLQHLEKEIRVISFDYTKSPLEVALKAVDRLKYLSGWEDLLQALMEKGQVKFRKGGLKVTWDFIKGDFPTALHSPASESWPKPHAVLFDAFSPAKNPAMWTLKLFSRMHELLDPARPCSLPTYSRSTMLRVTLLLAGFYVGSGDSTGEKEETTIAANRLELIERPLKKEWLRKVANSKSAEPLHEASYQQRHILPESFERLKQHPQFSQES
ncbi:MAG: MnmC family methyltransferase [Verrucomicrobiota bacterium]|nr:MnmC family methyltransferase [Verrucomicrobiota bacterium]